MPDWEADSPQLRHNLSEVFDQVAREARLRDVPTVESARLWHRLLLRKLSVPDPRYVGAFRGEPGMGNVQVRVGGYFGVAAPEVPEALKDFERKLQMLVAALDAELPMDGVPDADQLAAILDTCAWVHSEWVRVHPFANGNGRTARFWANGIAMRYGLPPFVRLRPRPNSGYERARAKAMQGDWKPTASVFRRLLEDFLRSE